MAKVTGRKANKSKRLSAKSKPKLKPNAQRAPVKRRQRPEASILNADDSRLGLSDLPGEIRNAVYELLLVPSDGAGVRLSATTQDLSLNILATCKAINKEASSVLYGKNIFRIDMLGIDPRTTYWPLLNNNHHDKWLRNALRTVWRMTPEGVKKIRCFSFVYHYKPSLSSIDPHNTSYALVDSYNEQFGDLPTEGDFAIQLEFLRKSPYFHLNSDTRLGKESAKDELAWGTEYAAARIRSIIDIHNLRCLTQQNVQDFANVLHAGFEEAALKCAKGGSAK